MDNVQVWDWLGQVNGDDDLKRHNRHHYNHNHNQGYRQYPSSRDFRGLTQSRVRRRGPGPGSGSGPARGRRPVMVERTASSLNALMNSTPYLACTMSAAPTSTPEPETETEPGETEPGPSRTPDTKRLVSRARHQQYRSTPSSGKHEDDASADELGEDLGSTPKPRQLLHHVCNRHDQLATNTTEISGTSPGSPTKRQKTMPAQEGSLRGRHQQQGRARARGQGRERGQNGSSARGRYRRAPDAGLATPAPHHSHISFPPPTPPLPHTRSPSPKRTIADLARLAKPVRITTTHRLHESLSEETRGLYRRLKDIERRQHILPRAAEALIRAEVEDVDLAEFMWQPLHTRTSDEVGTETKTETETRRAERTQAHAEFEAVLDIMFASNEAANEREGEPEWNEKVHYPVFELALGKPRHGALVQAQNITTARIAKPFQPPFRDSDDTMSVSSITTAASSSAGTADTDRGSTWQATPAGGTSTASVHKMVDYAMVLRLDREARNKDGGGEEDSQQQNQLLHDIEALVRQDGTGTINQSTYGPLCRFPIGVTVETKTAAGTLDKAQFQLAVWTAAWHVRMDKLGHSGPQLRILSLPLITVVDAQWMLYFAVDQGDSIDIINSSLIIGNTATVPGLYQLLASLRELSTWVQSEFRDWIARVVRDAKDRLQEV